ncbi:MULTISPECIES: hypothetical protein [Streptomyces]|uniref:hypothetical protein n=1 Tax=Streptomyces TaxID=1883 RepID=UPI0007CD74FD|nr:hypothetical protein A4V12_03910 [Streptomyces noursei]
MDAGHRVLLRGLLSHGGMDDATMDVWDGWAPVLSALLSEGAVAPGELLTLTAAPAGSGRVALAEAAAGRLRLLRGTGAGALLTGADDAAKSGSPGGDAGAVVAVEDVISWLDRFARRYRGMRQPVEGLPGLLAGIGARLRAEGVPYRALPALRMPDAQASSRDRCLGSAPSSRPGRSPATVCSASAGDGGPPAPPFTQPPNWWHLMRPRDEAGSARLRGVDTATAEDLLAAVGPETRADVGWSADARASTRGVHDTTERVAGGDGRPPGRRSRRGAPVGRRVPGDARTAGRRLTDIQGSGARG